MREFFQAQFQNRFLWMPFLMAGGAALYFTLNFEPNIPLPGMFAAILAVFAILHRMPAVIRAAALFMFGFLYACAFTYFIATPQITRVLRNTEIIGTVRAVDYTYDKTRVYIDAENINPNSYGRMIVRATLANTMTPPHIGNQIRAMATLFPPDAADAPGAFDYARWAYFNNITATGYLTDLDIINTKGTATFASMRDYIHTRANSFLTDSLVLGYRNSIPKRDAEIWTANGIAHVWSISGFHMTLIAGWLFAFFFVLMRATPYITRRIPARIPAMICALIGLAVYLGLSGGATATIRAFVMTALVFGAFIFGRSAISMRNICIAFCILFILNPHSIMQAGFQLSFAAVFGLVWFWNTYPKTPNNKFLKIIYVAAMTSIIATIFTTPFVAMHFGAIPIYGLVGNLILLPIFSFLIMPLVVVGTIAAMFGIVIPLNIANIIYEFALNIAQHIASIPGATITVPNISNMAIILCIIGFLCLMFIRAQRMRVNWALCGIFLSAATLTVIFSPRPVFFATSDHELVGFVNNGKLEFNKSRASNHFFTFDTWKQINGEETGTKNIRRKHNHGVYVFDTPNFRLVYIQKFVPLAENIERLCRDDTTDYIVSYFDVNAPACKDKILDGGFVIYKSGHVSYVPDSRRWHNRRR